MSRIATSDMEKSKQRRLELAGWKVGNTQDFLRLTDEEAAYVELKASLASRLRQVRAHKGLTQATAAKIVGSSQSRLARMEAGDSSVSVDLLFRTLFRLGVALEEVLRKSHTKRKTRRTIAAKRAPRKRSATTASGAGHVERRTKPPARM